MREMSDASSSCVVAELQLHRMGIEIDLPLQVRLIIFPHVMVHERYRDDQGNQSAGLAPAPA